MVKKENTKCLKHTVKKGFNETAQKSAKIRPNTHYELCDTRMTAFGDCLVLWFISSVTYFFKRIF